MGSWFAPHFSPRSPIFLEHPEWRITGPASGSYGGGYGFGSLNMVDWNTGIFDWVLTISNVGREAGLDYLGRIPYSNLGLLMSNYARASDNLDALGRLGIHETGLRPSHSMFLAR